MNILMDDMSIMKYKLGSYNFFMVSYFRGKNRKRLKLAVCLYVLSDTASSLPNYRAKYVCIHLNLKLNHRRTLRYN